MVRDGTWDGPAYGSGDQREEHERDAIRRSRARRPVRHVLRVLRSRVAATVIASDRRPFPRRSDF